MPKTAAVLGYIYLTLLLNLQYDVSVSHTYFKILRTLLILSC